ncbi:MAG TPA: serine hydrolase domain-containing protein, partial [Fimbriimonas sp.]
SGAAARRLVEAIDSGDPGKIDQFVREHLAKPDPMLWSTTENDRRLLVNAHEQSGGVEVATVLREKDPLVFELRAKRDGKIARVVISAKDSGELEGMEIEPVRPQSQNWPDEKLDEAGVVQAIQKRLDDLAKEDRWSGVVLVAKGDEVLLHTAHGLAERSFGAPIARDTKFDLASTPKMFTSIVVAQLAREGRLSIDDLVGKHLPDYPDAAVREKVTIRHLLSHTGGTGTLFYSPGYDRTRRYADAREMSTALHGEPLQFEPGTSWSYSNGGFVLLGAIIERLTGKTYLQAWKERILDPLGMKDTGVEGRTNIVPNLARTYDRDPLDPFGRMLKRLDSLQYGWVGGPHGGGHSTAMDMFRFARALRQYRLLPKGETERLFVKASHGPGYALGFETFERDGHLIIGHNGHKRSDFKVYWDLDLTVIVLGNDLSEHANGVGMQIRELVLRNASAFE